MNTHIQIISLYFKLRSTTANENKINTRINTSRKNKTQFYIIILSQWFMSRRGRVARKGAPARRSVYNIICAQNIIIVYCVCKTREYTLYMLYNTIFVRVQQRARRQQLAYLYVYIRRMNETKHTKKRE